MFKFALAPIALLTLFPFVLRPASSSAAPPPFTKVIVELKGQPLVANPSLKREPAPGFHVETDARLPEAQQYLHALSAYRAQEIAYLRGLGVQLNVGYQYGAVLNGFSATLPRAQLSRLSTAKNVVAVFPDLKVARPLIDHSVALTNAPAAWTALGGGPTAGKNIFIANIDTGIQITGPCFSGQNMPKPKYGLRTDTAANRKYVNNKVVVARAFGPNSKKKYSAADQQGHGTFTAAIEACDYNTPTPLGTKASGMAPDAYLMNYNVFPGQSAGTSDAQIAAALNAATLDGADVINLSLGESGGDWRLDPIDVIVQQLTKGGYAVAVAAGNAGPESQSIGSPADAPTAIAAGAVTNSRGIYTAEVNVTGSNVPAALQGIPATQGSRTFTNTVGPAGIVPVGLGRMPGDDPTDKTANDFAGKDLTGKIALIQRGTLTFETKINNAQKAGAIGAIIYNNRTEVGALNMDVGSATLPAVAISQSAGQALLQWVQQNPDTTASITTKTEEIAETPGVVADFTSVGPTAHYGIKPDIVAPGQDIYAPTQSQYSSGIMYSSTGWISEQGTSFSSPHVAGAQALLLQAHPKWTPAEVRAVLMNTASRSVYLHADKSGVPTVMQAGSGLLDVGAAVAAPAFITPASLSFNAINTAYGAITKRASLTLSNINGGAGTWQVTAQTLHGSPGVSVAAPASITLNTQQVTVGLNVHIAAGVAPADVDGYLNLTKGQTTLHVPYFIHVMSHKVLLHSILLVDEGASRYQPAAPLPQIKPSHVASYYENALRGLHRTFTYWNVARFGTPTLADMKRASLVIYFTGANLNDFTSANISAEATQAPIGPTDLAVLHDYLKVGGNVFLSGMGAVLSDPYFTAIPGGAEVYNLSMYDTSKNDPKSKGGVSPPRPSIVADGRTNLPTNSHMFGGLKPIDISTNRGADGAKDNLAVNNSNFGLIGVSGMQPVRGRFKPLGTAYGIGVLRASGVKGAKGQGADVAVASSDEPSLKHPNASYHGRTLLFSFGFEGINNNTGYATRSQVMRRVLQWFFDHPRVAVASPRSVGGLRDQLRARYSGAKPIKYTWQVGPQKLPGSRLATIHQFSHAGRYHVRVQVVDRFGHTAVSPWTWVTVQG